MRCSPAPTASSPSRASSTRMSSARTPTASTPCSKRALGLLGRSLAPPRSHPGDAGAGWLPLLFALFALAWRTGATTAPTTRQALYDIAIAALLGRHQQGDRAANAFDDDQADAARVALRHLACTLQRVGGEH